MSFCPFGYRLDLPLSDVEFTRGQGFQGRVGGLLRLLIEQRMAIACSKTQR
jgi:hypothetical protein